MHKTDMKDQGAATRPPIHLAQALRTGTSVRKYHRPTLPVRRHFAGGSMFRVKLPSFKKSTLGLFVLFTLWYNRHIATHQAAP
jgi:hypothetical protein